MSDAKTKNRLSYLIFINFFYGVFFSATIISFNESMNLGLWHKILFNIPIGVISLALTVFILGLVSLFIIFLDYNTITKGLEYLEEIK